MHEHAFALNRILSVTDCPELTSAAAMYGRGVFTTIAIYDGEPFLWEKHWRRLTRDAAVVGLDPASNDQLSVRAALDSVLRANSVRNGRARITFFDGSLGGVTAEKRTDKALLLITTDGPRHVPDRLRLGVSPFPVNSRSPLAGVKSCNYLENLLALEDARSRGFDEALRLNERGHITSACMANVFWTMGKSIFTPPVASGCLAGTTRELLMETIEVSEAEATLDDIGNAEAIFLTSAGLGITEAGELAGRSLGHVPAEVLSVIKRNTGAV